MRKSYKIIFATIFAAILFISCMPIRVGATKSAKNIFASFFVDGATQYFIKPLDYAASNGETLNADFTFKYDGEVRDSVIIKFSIVGEKLIKNLDNLTLQSGSNRVSSDTPQLMFNAKEKRGFTSRFTTKVSLADFIEISRNGFDFVIDFAGENQTTYSPTRATAKAIQKVNENIFVLF